MRGRFITFEGGEGTGKSSHSAMVAERLKERGIPVRQTREPGGTIGAEIVRHVLLSGAAQPFGPAAEAILFAAARDDHLNLVIRPALERGEWVVCDRFIDSTRVYQGILGQVPPPIIRALERIVVEDTVPDLTLILDVPAEIGLRRSLERRGEAGADRFEQEALAFHETLRQGFRAVAAVEPERCVLIDTLAPPHEVAERIWRVVEERLLRQDTLTQADATQ
ncbi:MAG TPA: dTMP kinase [Xanthobacteraceae bacterium]|nr:dTMP kinase [Xanthobacteraceae bacterium]